MAFSLPIPQDLSGDEYSAVEEALLSTRAGRAFLRMRDRKFTAAGAAEFRAGFERLQALVEKNGSALERSGAAIAGAVRVDVLRDELLEMAATIRRARTEIRAMKPPEGTVPGRIDLATEELDAIVRATEKATSDILSAAELLMEFAQKLQSGDPAEIPGIAVKLNDVASEIFMACGFQDITGQRISKVVSTLRHLETRVDSLLRIVENWGAGGAFQAAPEEGIVLPVPKTGDDALMNGPALHGGVDQSEVDRLMSSWEAAVTPDPVVEAPAPVPVAAAPPPKELVSPPPPPPPKPTPAPAIEVAAPGGVLDQSAIDSLFG